MSPFESGFKCSSGSQHQVHGGPWRSMAVCVARGMGVLVNLRSVFSGERIYECFHGICLLPCFSHWTLSCVRAQVVFMHLCIPKAIHTYSLLDAYTN